MDLQDIAFVRSTQATYVDNGFKTGGVLSVSDGLHTAKINLVGDYSTANFVCASDGSGGVFVSDPAKKADAQPPPETQARTHIFAAFAAGFGAPAAATVFSRAFAEEPQESHLGIARPLGLQ